MLKLKSCENEQVLADRDQEGAGVIPLLSQLEVDSFKDGTSCTGG